MADGVITGPDIDGLDPLVPESPVIGLPAGTKAAGSRVDFRDTQFDILIETKGLRVAWSQAAVCPCGTTNRQTDQPDLNCALGCNGTGYIYFRPGGYDPEADPDVGQLSEVQKFVINRSDSPGQVIRVVSIGMERKETAYDRIGQWGEGTVNVSFRKNHSVSHLDRLTYLDSILAYAQTVIATNPATTPVRLRFPALRVNFLRTETQLFEQELDFVLDDQGRVCFRAGRAPSGTNVLMSVHYLHHPQFLVVSYLNAIRDSLVTSKRAAAALRTPLGDHQKLPTRVMAQLEFLAGVGARSEVAG